MIFICVLFIFRFYCLPVFLLISQFLVYQRNPFRITLRYSIVSGHNGVGGGGEGGGRGATLCQKEDTQQFLQPEYCRLFAFKRALQRRKGARGHGHPRTPRPQLSPSVIVDQGEN